MLRLASPALLLAAGPAAAHGLPHASARPEWTFDPWILVPLLALGLPCALGGFRLARRSRRGRPVLLLRAAGFGCGWLALALALVSPLHWLGERLLTFHMIEHEILMAIAAPLIVAARPLGAMLWGLPRRWRLALGRWLRLRWLRRSWRWLTVGAAATVLHGLAIWGWHVPAAFDAALASGTLHRLQHLSFLGTAVLFWWSVLWTGEQGVAAWRLFVTMTHTALLGALMALAPAVLYRTPPGAGADWGMTPLEDQQLAGLLMWIPAGVVYAGAALAMAALWIRRSGAGHAPL